MQTRSRAKMDIEKVIDQSSSDQKDDMMEEEDEGEYFLIEDVIYSIFAVMPLEDLKKCRLVCRLWLACATKRLRELVPPIKIVRDRHGTKLNSFLETLLERSPHRVLPFSKFHIDLSCNIANCSKNLATLFEVLSQEVSCKKMKIIFTYRPDSTKDALSASKLRKEKMSFKHVEYFSFDLRFYDEFTPEFVNLKEMLENSVGLKKIGMSLNSYICKGMQKPIIDDILDTLTSPTNKFGNLSTFSFDNTFIDERILHVLTEWKQPLKSLAIGSFDLKPEKSVGTPTEAFYTFLESKSKYLQNLRLKFDKECPWEDMNNDQMEYNEHLAEFEPVARNYQTIFVNFPKLPHLLSLDIMAASPLETGWTWKLNGNSFSAQFPKLQSFKMINWLYLSRDNVDFLPTIYKPCPTIQVVRLPSPKHFFDKIIFDKMISVFPNMRELEIKYERATVEAVFTHCKNLEKLTIHVGEELVQLDSIFTGVPTLNNPKIIVGESAKNYKLSLNQTKPSLLNLQKLKMLYLTTEDYYIRIGDVTAYQVFLQLKDFTTIKIDAYPWDDATTWQFSPQCMEDLRKKIFLDMTVHTKTRRERFFY